MTTQTGAKTMTISDQILGSFKSNPEGLLLLAAGAVLLMRKPSAGRRENEFCPSTSGPGYVEQAQDAASSLASNAAGYATQAREAVGAQSYRIATSAKSTAQDAMSRILEDQPLMVAVAGLAAGAAVAAAFPTTTLERNALGPMGEQLSDAASRVGDQLKEASLKAGTTLKEAAQERGLSSEGLTGVVKEAAAAFSDTMQGGTHSGHSKEQPEVRSAFRNNNDQP